jgi:hypothetical protein
MRSSRLAFLILPIFLLCSFALGQTVPTETAAEKEKKKKEFDERILAMLDEAVVGANGLRLPGNRAIVYAITGDLYWKYDDKRARELFRNSAAEIVNNNTETERQKLENPEMFPGELEIMFDVRPQVLPIIARRDPELALELLTNTRSTKLAEAITAGTTDPTLMSRVNQELALEQQFASLAADKDPELAIKLIKESLAKGVSFNVLGLLQKLFTKDEKKANELGAEVLKRLGDSDLARNTNEMNVALNFLQFGARPAAANAKTKQFTFTEVQMRELAGRVAAALVAPSNTSTQAMSMMSRAIPILEKIAPDRAQVVRQRHTTLQRNMPSDLRNMQQQQRLWDPNSTPEEILSMIPRMTSDNEKNNAYQAVAGKIAQVTDDARAKRLIDQIPDERARTSAREQFEAMRLGRLASTGKLEEARRAIAGLTDRRRKIQSLINLAQQHHRRKQEADVETAASLMTEAKSLVADYPEDADEIELTMMIAGGYSTIDPDIGFRMVEPVIDALNEHTQAMAVISKYDKRNRDFRKGELVMRVGGGGSNLLLIRYVPQMQMLGRSDFERMNMLADRFTRADARMMVKLLVLQAAAPQPARPPAM